MVIDAVRVQRDSETFLVHFGKALKYGRDRRTCEIVFPADARGISRVHGEIIWNVQGVTVSDNSSYGTKVDDEVVLKSSRSIDSAESKLTIGEFVLTLFIEHKAEFLPPLERDPLEKFAVPKAQKRISSFDEPLPPTVKKSKPIESSLKGSQATIGSFFQKIAKKTQEQSQVCSSQAPNSEETTRTKKKQKTKNVINNGNIKDTIGSDTFFGISIGRKRKSSTPVVLDKEEFRPLCTSTQVEPTEAEGTTTARRSRGKLQKVDENKQPPFYNELIEDIQNVSVEKETSATSPKQKKIGRKSKEQPNLSVTNSSNVIFADLIRKPETIVLSNGESFVKQFGIKTFKKAKQGHFYYGKDFKHDPIPLVPYKKP